MRVVDLQQAGLRKAGDNGDQQGSAASRTLLPAVACQGWVLHRLGQDDAIDRDDLWIKHEGQIGLGQASQDGGHVVADGDLLQIESVASEGTREIGREQGVLVPEMRTVVISSLARLV